MTHLDHDHRESENVPFLTSHSPIQDLGRGPTQSVTTSNRAVPRGVQVSSDCGKAEISDTYPTSLIDEDVFLFRCQYRHERGLKEGHTPLRSPWIILQECR
jgi:hypothetical protein